MTASIRCSVLMLIPEVAGRWVLQRVEEGCNRFGLDVGTHSAIVRQETSYFGCCGLVTGVSGHTRSPYISFTSCNHIAGQ